MACVDIQRKQILLLPHKTGTHSIRQIFVDLGRESDIFRGKTNHPSIDMLFQCNPVLGDFREYGVYAFYREPIDKFVSFMAHRYNLTPHTKNIRAFRENTENFGSFVPQVRWLKHDDVDVNLLDYRNFDSELRKVFEKFGIPQDIHIPTLNVGGQTKEEILETMTEEDVDFIREEFVVDYQFFASKGITFNV